MTCLIKSAASLIFLLAITTVIPVQAEALHSAAEPDYPPFSIVTPDGCADGLAVELLRATLAAMNRDVEFKTGPWDQIKTELAEGKIDVLPLVGRTPEREHLYDFTVPYLTLHGALFVRTNEAQIRSLADLPGRTIAVMRGDNAEEYILRSKLSDNLVRTSTFDEAFRMLSEGKADAVIAQKLMGIALLQQAGISNIHIVGPTNQEFKQDFCFAVQEGNRELLAALNEGLSLIIADGTYRRIRQKWLGFGDQDTFFSRVLLFAGANDNPPYEFLDKNGEPAGFNVDFIRAVAQSMGLSVEFHLTSWADALSNIKSGSVDALMNVAYAIERTKEFDFCLPHLSVYSSLYAAPHSPAYHGRSRLGAVKVACRMPEVAGELLNNEVPEITIVPAESDRDAMRLLASKAADFALISSQPELLLGKKECRYFTKVDSGLYPLEKGVAVQKSNEMLIRLLDEGFRRIKSTGEYDLIRYQWLRTIDSSLVWERISRVIGSVSIVLLLISGGLGLWISSLHRQIRKKTAALQEEEQRFEIATSAAGIGVWDRDIVNNRLIWDDWMYRLYGIRPEDFSGAYEAWRKCVHPDDLPATSHAVYEAEKNAREFNTSFRIVRPDGNIRYIRAFGKVIRADDGTPLRMIGINYDITERKEAEKELLHRNQELEQFNKASVGRELRMVELKREINELCRQLGEKARYPLVPESGDTP